MENLGIKKMTCVQDRELKIIFVVPSMNNEYLGIGILVSILKQKGYSVMLCASTEESILSNLNKDGLNLVAFSSYTPYIKTDLSVAEKLKEKEPSVCVVFGGPHVTFDTSVIKHRGVDALCRGESENAFPAFVDAYSAGEGELPINIKNWIVKKDGNVYNNELGDVVLDLDQLSFADRSFSTGSYFFKKGFRRFMFSRGCPYSCSYCSVPSLRKIYKADFKGFFRFRSVDNCISEIKSVLASSGGKTLGFVDSIFGLNPDWLLEFSEKYPVAVGKPFYCHSEVKVINRRYVDLLKKSGCYFVLLGFESASEDVRSDVLNKHFSNIDFLKAAALFKEAGIRVGVYNMIGLPGGTLDDDLETLRFNQTHRTFFPECHVYSFYPGTDLYEKYGKGMEQSAKIDVNRGVYWQPVTYKEIRPDIHKLIRLQYLFNLFVYYRVPILFVRIIITLPLGWFYSFIAGFYAKSHYARYEPVNFKSR